MSKRKLRQTEKEEFESVRVEKKEHICAIVSRKQASVKACAGVKGWHQNVMREGRSNYALTHNRQP